MSAEHDCPSAPDPTASREVLPVDREDVEASVEQVDLLEHHNVGFDDSAEWAHCSESTGTKLASRATDPTIGPAAEHRREADVLDATRQDRIGQELEIEGPMVPTEPRHLGVQDETTGPDHIEDADGSPARPVTVAAPRSGESS